jgi:hypothetical protein
MGDKALFITIIIGQYHTVTVFKEGEGHYLITIYHLKQSQSPYGESDYAEVYKEYVKSYGLFSSLLKAANAYGEI